MKPLPATKNALVLRTDFADEAAWQAICAAIQRPSDGFLAYVDFVNDPDYAGLEPAALLTTPSEEPDRSFVFMVDRAALSQPDQPILVVDLLDEPGRTFRVIPAGMAAVENNLSLANLGFADFAEAVDRDGVFRGFPMTEAQRATESQTRPTPKRTTKRPPSTWLGRALIAIYKLLRGKPNR